METEKQNADFLHVGEKLLAWYKNFGRDLPFRHTKDPYKIWICEVVFQQTRIDQGLKHYEKFIQRFPTVQDLAKAETDEVLLYWKGLGYYSRALNLHKASQQIIKDFHGKFPKNYHDIIKLSGVGKYTAAAICSISYNKRIPAVDGNFYRVLSRVFADDFDISSSKAFQYFTDLALKMMPEKRSGNFNEAMMDLGSEICKPKNPNCGICPLNKDCIAFNTGKISEFPVKTKKLKTTDLVLKYYFVEHGNSILIKQRDESFIWKKLFEFPTAIPVSFDEFVEKEDVILHKLTHKNLKIHIYKVVVKSRKQFEDFAKKENYQIIDAEEFHQKSFPKPLQTYFEKL